MGALIFILSLSYHGLLSLVPVKVDGHDGPYAGQWGILVLKYQSIDRFDIAVATETDNDGTTKEIVKRVIGMPGRPFSMKMILFTSPAKQTSLYLTDYIKNSKKTKLQSTYTGDDYDDWVGVFFRKLAAQAQAFTVDSEGSPCLHHQASG